MSPAAVNLPPMPSGAVAASSLLGFDSMVSRLSHLRGVRWRINLCNLRPCSIDDLRRVTADYRRRYAALRRRLLIDSYISRDRSSSPDLAMDNPLSENPDSMWGRFFRNAELEKMLDQDLSRLYPEHGSYFQTPECQCMLRRILLLWCLRHPEYGYQQGMHELLAPLLYVLHADLRCLSEARKLYEDHFTDKFDDALSQENNLTYNFDFRRIPDFIEYDPSSHEKAKRFVSFDELDPAIQSIVLLSDAYGVEGELGVVLSEKFMEHDVYCMFDALMSGVGGAVAMAEFFAPSSGVGSQTGIAPVIEASSTIYHLLSVVDPSLYSHLVELGVEPQYFALRWLRVLFGREFSLENLLIVWDGVFSLDNASLRVGTEDELGPSSRILNSRRGAFISAMAVSMMLHIRSSLLATEIVTSCLQRLLNFPGSIDLDKLLEKAKSLLAIALDANASSPYAVSGSYKQRKSSVRRGHSLSFESGSTEAPLVSVPERYWEEKWSDLNKEEDLKKKNTSRPPSAPKRGWTQKIKMRLPWTESEPSLCSSKRDARKEHKPVRRSLLQDLARQLGEEIDDVGASQSNQSGDVHNESVARVLGVQENLGGIEKTLSRQSTTSEENSPFFSDPESPTSGSNSLENDTEESSDASSASHDMNEKCSHIDPVHSVLDSSVASVSSVSDSPHLSQMDLREKKSLSGRFQWLWKLVRHASGEGPPDKGNVHAIKSKNDDGQSSTMAAQPASENEYSSVVSARGDVAERNPSCTLMNLGHSMLENIQVIESVLQQDNVSNKGLVEKGQERAMSALKELRKMSSILLEM